MSLVAKGLYGVPCIPLIKVAKKVWDKHYLTCKYNLINLSRLEKVKKACAKEETFSVNNSSVYWIT